MRDLSIDHVPDNIEEKKRILACGHLLMRGRVDASLAMSRAIGDWKCKDPHLGAKKMAIISLPEVQKLPITPAIDYLVSACDGIWDCMTSDEVI